MADDNKVIPKTTKKVSKKIDKKVPAAKKVTKKAPAAKKTATKKTTSKKATTKKATTKKTVTKKVAGKTSKSSAKVTAENKLEQLQALLRENLSNLNTEKAEALARNIWLAGLGAYSRSLNEFVERREDIQGRVEAMNAEGQKLFEELVKRGKEMQGDAEKVMQQGRMTIEDRVEEFKQRFGGGLSSFIDIPARLREAAERIEEISERLNKKK